MEIHEFNQQISRQRIDVRDSVTVVTRTYEITGTIVPCDIIVSVDCQILSRIIHKHNEQLLISIKTIPDGIGPDVGTPVPISDIVSITKEN